MGKGYHTKGKGKKGKVIGEPSRPYRGTRAGVNVQEKTPAGAGAGMAKSGLAGKRAGRMALRRNPRRF